MFSGKLRCVPIEKLCSGNKTRTRLHSRYIECLPEIEINWRFEVLIEWPISFSLGWIFYSILHDGVPSKRLRVKLSDIKAYIMKGKNQICR